MSENEDGLKALSLQLGTQKRALSVVRGLAAKFAAAGCRLSPLAVGESRLGNGHSAPFIGLELDLGEGLTVRIALRNVPFKADLDRQPEIVRTEAGLWLFERTKSLTGRSVIAVYRRCEGRDTHWTFKVRIAPGRSRRLLGFCRSIDLDHIQSSQGEIEANQADSFIAKAVCLAVGKKAKG